MTDTVKTRTKMILIAILLVAVSVPAVADDAMWTWVSGDNSFNPTGTNNTPRRTRGMCLLDRQRRKPVVFRRVWIR